MSGDAEENREQPRKVSWSWCRGLNLVPLEYEVGVINTEPRPSVLGRYGHNSHEKKFSGWKVNKLQNLFAFVSVGSYVCCKLKQKFLGYVTF